MGTCAHHVPGRWSKRWDGWLISSVGSFFVLEYVALQSEGAPATLSAYLRRLAGVDPRCRHCSVGRVLILGVLAWAALHLGWGLLGWGGRSK